MAILPAGLRGNPGGARPDLNVHRLQLCIFLDAVAASVASDARLLEAADRHFGSAGKRGVDPDPARLDAAHCGESTLEIGRPDAGSKSILRRVGETHGLVLRVERHDREHRPEDLIARDFHHLRDTLEHGRLYKQARLVADPLATAGEDSATRLPSRDISEDLVELALIDYGADLCPLVERVAHSNLRGERDDLFGQLARNFALRHKATARDAALPG